MRFDPGAIAVPSPAADATADGVAGLVHTPPLERSPT
jgi:hypothetical protein